MAKVRRPSPLGARGSAGKRRTSNGVNEEKLSDLAPLREKGMMNED